MTAAADREAPVSLAPPGPPRCLPSMQREKKNLANGDRYIGRSPPRWRRICYHDKSTTAKRIRPYQRTTPQITSTGRAPMNPRPWYRALAALALHKDRRRAALKVDLCVRRVCFPPSPPLSARCDRDTAASWSWPDRVGRRRGQELAQGEHCLGGERLHPV